jgi:hypothetical protein
MGNETGGIPDQTGGDAQSALESAARHLRAVPRPSGFVQTREREVFAGRQSRDLLAWAGENSRIIEANQYLPFALPGGEEHRIWQSPDGLRVFKATRPGVAGFTVIAEQMPGSGPVLTNALPLEYFERLLLQIDLFGDDLLLEGIALESERIVIITSQRLLEGVPPSGEEIVEFMQRLWFAPLDGLSLGNPGSLAFYRDLDEVAIFDAHPGNFVKDTGGAILPIDLIMVRADADLQHALEGFLQTG